MDNKSRKTTILFVIMMAVALVFFAFVMRLDNDGEDDYAFVTTHYTTVTETIKVTTTKTSTPKPHTTATEQRTYGYVPSPQAKDLFEVELAD